MHTGHTDAYTVVSGLRGEGEKINKNIFAMFSGSIILLTA